MPVPAELDETRRPDQTLCPMDADSSQLAAVFARPGARLSAYDAVMFDRITVSYKRKPRVPTKPGRESIRRPKKAARVTSLELV